MHSVLGKLYSSFFFFRTQAKLVVTLVCGGISEKKNSPGEGERRQCVCEEERNLDTRL